MKNLKLKFGNLLFNLVIAFGAAMLFGLPVAPVAAVSVAAGVVLGFVKLRGAAFMALQKEIWEADIIDNLFKDNAFAKRSVDASEFVLGGKVVHIPVAGVPEASKKNLTVFPQVAKNRQDSELTYILNKLYRLPKTIEKLEQYEISYDKRQSVAGEEQAQLIEDAMDSLLVEWSPEKDNILETDGDATSVELVAGATGSRKTFTKNSVLAIAKKFANARLGNVPKVALFTAYHYYQFLNSLSEGEKTAVNNVADMKNGIVGRYLGFDIMLRSQVLRYRKTAGVWTVVDELAADFAPAAGDSAASLFWADSCVEQAVGQVNVFDDTDNPLYYGDVLSMNMRYGGRKRRIAGVYGVVDAVAS